MKAKWVIGIIVIIVLVSKSKKDKKPLKFEGIYLTQPANLNYAILFICSDSENYILQSYSFSKIYEDLPEIEKKTFIKNLTRGTVDSSHNMFIKHEHIIIIKKNKLKRSGNKLIRIIDGGRYAKITPDKLTLTMRINNINYWYKTTIFNKPPTCDTLTKIRNLRLYEKVSDDIMAE